MMEWLETIGRAARVIGVLILTVLAVTFGVASPVLALMYVIELVKGMI